MSRGKNRFILICFADSVLTEVNANPLSIICFNFLCHLNHPIDYSVIFSPRNKQTA
ncbi:hypothetical protein EVA_01437 [gut metagenome]|uniref:Uncharacterized protein n=1 Tax=gut metagenome TaxID=749906 RepID=J9H7U3_9ZZZZ